MIIKYKNGICSRCKKNKLITQKSKKLCQYCNSIISIERAKLKRELKKQKNNEYYEKLDKFYKEVWQKSPDKLCYETNEPIRVYRKWHIHHVLEKKLYPQHTFNTDVCVLLTLEQHSLWHTLAPSDREKKMPKTWAKYIELINKYETR